MHAHIKHARNHNSYTNLRYKIDKNNHVVGMLLSETKINRIRYLTVT